MAGTRSAWRTTFQALAARYRELSVTVAELAQEVSESNRIMRELPDGHGLGTFIWEPTANNNRQALIDRDGTVIRYQMRLHDELE